VISNKKEDNVKSLLKTKEKGHHPGDDDQSHQII